VPTRATTNNSPSVLGFYKEKDGPETWVAEICGDPSGLYLEVPTHLRNRLEVVVGSRFVGKLASITKRNGKRWSAGAEGLFEVKGYWNEMHFPAEMVRNYGLEKGDFVEIVLYQIITYGKAAAV